jgi:hypothetical protein
MEADFTARHGSKEKTVMKFNKESCINPWKKKKISCILAISILTSIIDRLAIILRNIVTIQECILAVST